MKVAIVGTRNPSVSYEQWTQVLKDMNLPTVAELVSGGAKGIDSYTKRLSKESGIPLIEFNPDYARSGRNAPLVRNTQIVQYADIVVAFPSEDSRGTYDTISKSYKHSKQVIIKKI